MNNNDVLIRSAEQYFEEYGREKIYKQKMDRLEVKKQLINAFHNEIFSLVAMRAKKQFKDIPKEGDPEALRIARNVVKDATKKWVKLVRMFEMYSETSGVIKPEDISLIPEEDEIGFDNGELVTRDIPASKEESQGTDEVIYDGTVQVDQENETPMGATTTAAGTHTEHDL